MEKRFGAIVILLTNKSSVPRINTLLSEYSDMVLGRQGIPIREEGIHIISLVVEGTTDQINAFTGKVGKLEGAEVKSILTKYRKG